MIKKRCIERNSTAGFGMIETLIVVAIVGALFVFVLKKVYYTDEGGEATKPHNRIEQAQGAASVAEKMVLKTAIMQYQVANGENPPTLRALVDEGFATLSAIRDGEGIEYDYDPETGTVE